MTTLSLVEDDSSFCVLLTRALSKDKKLKIVGAHPNAEEAIREIPQSKPDVVLMDIKLPGMDGIECLRRLKTVSPPLHFHALILTEYEDSDLVEWMKRVKAQEWEDAFVFFKHEDEGTGPKWAAQFLEVATR